MVASAVHVFPRTDRAATTPIDRRAIGLLRDSLGTLSLVPSPLPSREIVDPRVVAASDGGWHAVFVTGTRGTAWSQLAFGTAAIWYGRFTGRTWEDVQQVSEVRDALLSPRQASNLVLASDGPAFAFVFDRSHEARSNAAGNQGVVMLRRTGDRWIEDTLQTWEAPQSLHLTSRTGGGVLALIVQSYFKERRPRGPALFTAGYDSTWTVPRLVYEPTPDKVADVIAPASGEYSHALSWRTYTPAVERERLEWGVVQGDSVKRISVMAEVSAWATPAVVRMGPRHVVWLVRQGDSQERLAVYSAIDTTLQTVGVVTTPLINFVTHAALLKNRRILAITGGPDTSAGAEPPFASYFTEISVQCPVAPDRTDARMDKVHPRSPTTLGARQQLR
jgi:hypothetical protein